MSVIGYLSRGSLLILGTVLLVGSICLGFYTKAVLDNSTSKAEALVVWCITSGLVVVHVPMLSHGV